MAAENAGCSHSTARILETPLSLKSSRCHTSEAGQDVRACQIGRVSSRTTINRRDVVCGLMRQSFLPSRSSGCHSNCQRRCSGKIRTKLSAAYFTTPKKKLSEEDFRSAMSKTRSSAQHPSMALSLLRESAIQTRKGHTDLMRPSRAQA